MTNVSPLSLIRNGRNLMGFPMTMHGSPRLSFNTAWNPADKNVNVVLSNGNLTATSNSTSSNFGVRATAGKQSGKWIFDISVDVDPSGSTYFGLGTSGLQLSGEPYQVPGFWGFSTNGLSGRNGTFTDTGQPLPTGSYVTLAVDFAAGTIAAYKSGVLFYTITSVPNTALLYPYLSLSPAQPGSNPRITANFAASSFPQSGYLPWA